MKILTIVGTRPEIIRLSRIIPKLDEFFEHKIVHTGQNYDYELNQIFFENLAIRSPDYIFDLKSKTAAETIGNIIIEIDKVFDIELPDAILILGDTNSALSAIAAKRRKIPIFHMEAGNRCFDLRVPEEINRKIVDHIADVNLTYSSISREYLLREGLPPDMIIKTGSPMFEVLNFYKESIDASNVLKDLNLKKNDYFLVSCHREENIENKDKLNDFVKMLNGISEYYDKEIIVSTHPRTRNKISSSNLKLKGNIKLVKPLSFTDYNKLQISAKVVFSDSGTINEESSILNFAALNIRDCHERPEASEEASVMMVGFDLQNIKIAINLLKKQKTGDERTLSIVKDYSVPNVSEKIIRIILSHINYINRKTWSKK